MVPNPLFMGRRWDTKWLILFISCSSPKQQQLQWRSSNVWSSKWLFAGRSDGGKGLWPKMGPAKVTWFKTYRTTFLHEGREQEMSPYLGAGSTSLWSLMWADRESSVTCREPYYFWFTFVLENVRDQNTLAKHRNERGLFESAVHVQHEYKCVLFIKACLTTSLGSEFNQVRRLSPFRSINLRLNRLPLHVTRHMAMF